MSLRYKAVLFSPLVGMGAVFPIAFLVEDARARVRVFAAPHLPDPKCLGGPQAFSLMHMIVADLASVESFSTLPSSVGPHVALGPIRSIPASIEPDIYFRKIMFPELPARPAEKDLDGHPRVPRRSAFGDAFFRANRVDRYVHRKFDPSISDRPYLRQAEPLGLISHFVVGVDSSLLMEPLSPVRPQFGEDVKKVALRMGAYRAIIDANEGAGERLVAFILPGGGDARLEAKRHLAPFVHDVVDLELGGDREAFLSGIVTMGSQTQRLLS